MPHTLLHQNHLIRSFHQQIDETTLNQSIRLALNNKQSYLAFSFKVNEIDTLTHLSKLVMWTTFSILLGKASDEFSISSGGELARIVNEGPEDFKLLLIKAKVSLIVYIITKL